MVAGALALGACGSPPSARTLPPPAASASAAPTVFTPQVAHGRDATLLAITSDASLLVSGGDDGSVRIWDATTGVMLRALTGHGPVGHLAILPGDRKVLATSDGADAALRLWDIERGSLLRTFASHDKPVVAMAVSPDGHFAVTATKAKAGGALRLWDLQRSEAVATVPSNAVVVAAAFSSDGKSLTILTSDAVQSRDASQLTLLRTVSFEPKLRVDRASISPDRTRALAVTFERDEPARTSGYATVLVELATGKVQERYAGWGGYASGAVWSADSSEFVLHGSGGRIERHRRDGGGRYAVVPGSGREKAPLFTRVALLLPSTRRIAYGTSSGDVGVFALDADRPVWIVPGRSPVGRKMPGFLDAHTVYVGDRAAWDLDVLAAVPVRNRVTSFMQPGDAVVRSPVDRDMLAGISKDDQEKLVLYDGSTGEFRPIRVLQDNFQAHSVAFSADGKRVVAEGNAGEVAVWEVESGKRLHDLVTRDQKPGIGLGFVATSPDGAWIAYADFGGGVRVWNATSFALERTIEDGGRVVVFLHSASLLATGGIDGTIRVWNVATGRLEQTLAGAGGPIEGLAVSPDDRFLLSSRGGIARLWRRETGASVCLLGDEREWLVYDDEGWFDASRTGGALMAAVSGLRGYRIDQLAMRNNRPDLLLERMGLGEPALRNHLRALHEARARRAGIGDSGAAQSEPPRARIKGIVQDSRAATVELELAAGGSPLHHYDVYVNDVPLFDGGRPVQAGTTNASERVELASGRNRIEVEVTDRKGFRSARDATLVTGRSDEKEELWFVGFGVSEYRDPRLALRYASKDAKDLEATIKSVAAGKYGAIHTRTFTDAEVTPESISAAKGLLAGARVNDTVIVFVAGHGTYVGGEYAFVPHGVDVRRLHDTVVPFALLESLLVAIPPRKRLLLLDTCESGERAEAEAQAAPVVPGSRGLRSRAVRGLVLDDSPPSEGTARRLLPRRDRFIHGDLFRRTGAIVFSSSLGTESSYEDDGVGNGLFTADLMLALTSPAADSNGDHWISMNELHAFVGAAVPARSNDAQHPVVERDNLETGMKLPVGQEPGQDTTEVCDDGYVLVPESTFWLGPELSPIDAHEGASYPVHVPSFCMMRTEVTVAQYARCAAARTCAPAPAREARKSVDAEADVYSAFCNANRRDRAKHPVNCIDWTMADAYCRFDGGRLPKEQEWELAASGDGGRYEVPWGAGMPDTKHVNGCDRDCVQHFAKALKRPRSGYPESDGWVATAPVGSFPAGASKPGILDLAGNVWEWTSSFYCPYPKTTCETKERVVRGWGWEGPIGSNRMRVGHDPVTSGAERGVRCVKAPRSAGSRPG